jgi:hypothetical protein
LGKFLLDFTSAVILVAGLMARIFFIARHMFWNGASSTMRGGVWLLQLTTHTPLFNVGSGKMLLAFTSTGNLGFVSHQELCPNLYSFKIFTCLEVGPPLPRQKWFDYYSLSDGCWFWASHSGKLLLAFASMVILGSGPCRTHDHIFLPHISDCVAA